MSKLVLNRFGKTFDLLLNILDLDKNLKNGGLWYIDSDGEGIQIAEEYCGGVDKIIADTRKYYRNALEFVQIYQEQEKDIARDLSGGALKILCFLRSYMKFGNKVYGITNAYISDYLNMNIRTVSRSMKELYDYGLISYLGKKHNRVIKINPANTTKGKYNQFKKIINDFEVQMDKKRNK